MGVTGPFRCAGCNEPYEAADRFCGRCGAALPAAAGTSATQTTPTTQTSSEPSETSGSPDVPEPSEPSETSEPSAYELAPPAPPVPPRPPVPPVPPVPPAGGSPAGPPPDPGTRLPGADAGPPAGPPTGPPAAPPTGPPAGPPAGPSAGPPADPRVAGYEAVADAAAGATADGAGAAAPEETPFDAPSERSPFDPPSGGSPFDPPPAPAPPAAAPAPEPAATGPERDHMERELAGIAAVSDRGHRHHRNEDFFALRAAALPDGAPAVMAVVCDGVSSATRPDDASLAASEAAGEALAAALPRGTHPQQAMHEAVLTASAAVDALAADPSVVHDEHRQQNAPACTIVGVLVGGELLTVGWVGDSRAYWIPNDRTAPPVRLTEDDSWAAQMVANNLMSEEEANADQRAHAITGWLGADAYEVEPHTASFKPDGPGVVVVCTDGLWNYADTAEQMAAVLPYDAPARPLPAARALVAHALAGGGHDNVTVAVVPFPAPAPGRTG
ncbi:PP2C family protein-serine/threonine phosphatase [Streptomyces sp. N2A]|uniref:PP2C family protein-serine/threonine phosphatase n=1 Tax=Streptomyces sp. N2A TaxID=3073936 RepID=UPI00287019D5|nr:PP2C family protein-serine/threonine phosphatase [Streptomyces sp. N2A]